MSGTRPCGRWSPKTGRAARPASTFVRSGRGRPPRDPFSTVAVMPRARVLADLTPLRESRDYRLLFSGQVSSYLCRQFTVVAIPIQVFAITHSSLAVGLVGLASLGPLIGFSLAGGAFSDAFYRRRLLLINQVLLAATSAVLAFNATVSHPALCPLYVFGALSAG